MAAGANVHGGLQGRRIVVPIDSVGTPPVRITGYVGEFETPPNSPRIIDYSPASGGNSSSYVFWTDFPAGSVAVFVHASDGTFRRYVCK